MSQERTLVLVKPDGVARGLVGEVIKRFENIGLKLELIKVGTFTVEHTRGHLPEDAGWQEQLGRKTREYYREHSLDQRAHFGREIEAFGSVGVGRLIAERVAKSLASGPLVAMVWSGAHATQLGRKVLGSTMPLNAAPGTIRGDYSIDSPEEANAEERGLRNIAHASDSPAESEREIAHWFKLHERLEMLDKHSDGIDP